MKNIPMTQGLVTSIFLMAFYGRAYPRVRKAPYNAKLTRAALPIANPLPIAAVVFPAESNASVLFLTILYSELISAIPPALSEMGP